MPARPRKSPVSCTEAIACQKRPRSSRCHADGRPGDRCFSRVHLSEARLWIVIATSNQLVLRRPLESAQYVSIRYSERLAEAGIDPSVGSVGDSYDNALAETINGLYKAEVIHRRGPWRNFEAVEFATLEWVDFRNGAVGVKYPELTRMQHDAVDRPRASLNLGSGERGLLVSKSSSLAGMVLPSVVGVIAATPCLVQERFPRAHLVRVLEAMLGYSRPIGVIGYRVPARDLEDPALHARPVNSSW